MAKTSTTATSSLTAADMISPSIYKALRYVEWTFLGVIALRFLLLILNTPLGYEISSSDYIALGMMGVLAILSRCFPIHRPMWQRRIYILIEIICLLISRTFSMWGLDPFLYLILVKSCFLLCRRDVIFTTLVAGIAWQLSLASQVFYQFSKPVEEIRETFEASLELPKPLLVLDIVINSSVVYIAMSLLVILLSMTVVAERKSRQQAAVLSQEVETLAADLERTRIARDIHDSLGHTLTTLDVQLEVAQTLRHQDPNHADQALARAKTLSSQSLQEVRRAVSTIRRGNFDLPAALVNLVEQVKQTQPLKGAPLTVNTEINLPEVPLQVSQQLFLIVKEGLANIQKHSQASIVKLWAHTTPEGITLGLSDNGIGFSPNEPRAGFGLRGMQERVQLLEGKMTVNSTLGKGTLIQVTIPT